MPDFRAFCQPPEPQPAEITLSRDESHHLVTVNRARSGDTVVVFDGRGSEWTGVLKSPDRKAAAITVHSRRQAQPLPYLITLGQALPKGSSMDAIVQKATELGVSRIVPLESERTQVHLDRDREEKKVEKWRTVALEAAKQCGNPWLPEIEAPRNVSAVIASARDYDLRLIASLHPGARSLKGVLASLPSAPVRVLWLVGPEGDFTPAEMQAAQAAGFEPITLGPLVLRCETAAIYAVSVLSYELQNRSPAQ